MKGTKAMARTQAKTSARRCNGRGQEQGQRQGRGHRQGRGQWNLDGIKKTWLHMRMGNERDKPRKTWSQRCPDDKMAGHGDYMGSEKHGLTVDAKKEPPGTPTMY